MSFLQANPYPDTNKALSNINMLGPTLLIGLSKYVDMNCQHQTQNVDETCFIPKVYGDYLKSASFLKEKSSAEINDLYIPEEITNVDYRATNWHLGPFTTTSIHAQIIENIYKVEITKHLLSLLVEKFKDKLDTWYSQIPRPYRYHHIPLMVAWLSGSSKFSQYYHFTRVQTCLAGQPLCLDQNKQYRSVIASVRQKFSQTIINTKSMIENYSPQPWEEARLLKQIYDLDNHIMNLKKLDLKSTLALWKGDISSLLGFQSYFEEVMSITSMPKMLSDANQVMLYRQVINLKEIERISQEPVPSADTNTALHELLSDSVSETVNTIGEFYLARERDVTNGL